MTGDADAIGKGTYSLYMVTREGTLGYHKAKQVTTFRGVACDASSQFTIFIYTFCWTKAISVRSDHCIAGLWDVRKGGGHWSWEKWTSPYRSGHSAPSALAHGLVRTTTAKGGHPVSGGDTRPTTYLVDDVHQARMTEGVEGWGMTLGEDEKWIGCSL